ncbi:hypothetical protein Btru_007245 [Bulinus truncatus]|nr:hypothetical protein Btru_007245 [Bulinus truncatus]
MGTEMTSAVNSSGLLASSNGSRVIDDVTGSDYLWIQSLYMGYLWTALVIGLPGNMLIAMVYKSVQQKRTSDWFIFFLSIYDCAVCVFAVPLYLSIETGAWMATGSDLACKIEQFIISTAQVSSVSILGIIAVDRYLKICFPTKRSLNATQARNIGICTPLFSAAVAAPVLVWDGNVEHKFCRLQDHYQNTLGQLWERRRGNFQARVKVHRCLIFGFFVCMFFLVMFCYLHVSIVVRRRVQRHKENALKRKHLMQIPAFLQAISNVDDDAENAARVQRGKRKFSLFSLGSSRRLSAISPWIKARLSLPSENVARTMGMASAEMEPESKESLAESKKKLDKVLQRKSKSMEINDGVREKKDPVHLIHESTKNRNVGNKYRLIKQRTDSDLWPVSGSGHESAALLKNTIDSVFKYKDGLTILMNGKVPTAEQVDKKSCDSKLYECHEVATSSKQTTTTTVQQYDTQATVPIIIRTTEEGATNALEDNDTGTYQRSAVKTCVCQQYAGSCHTQCVSLPQKTGKQCGDDPCDCAAAGKNAAPSKLRTFNKESTISFQELRASKLKNHRNLSDDANKTTTTSPHLRDMRRKSEMLPTCRHNKLRCVSCKPGSSRIKPFKSLTHLQNVSQLSIYPSVQDSHCSSSKLAKSDFDLLNLFNKIPEEPDVEHSRHEHVKKLENLQKAGDVGIDSINSHLDTSPKGKCKFCPSCLISLCSAPQSKRYHAQKCAEYRPPDDDAVDARLSNSDKTCEDVSRRHSTKISRDYFKNDDDIYTMGLLSETQERRKSHDNVKTESRKSQSHNLSTHKFLKSNNPKIRSGVHEADRDEEEGVFDRLLDQHRRVVNESGTSRAGNITSANPDLPWSASECSGSGRCPNVAATKVRRLSHQEAFDDSAIFNESPQAGGRRWVSSEGHEIATPNHKCPGKKRLSRSEEVTDPDLEEMFNGMRTLDYNETPQLEEAPYTPSVCLVLEPIKNPLSGEVVVSTDVMLTDGAISNLDGTTENSVHKVNPFHANVAAVSRPLGRVLASHVLRHQGGQTLCPRDLTSRHILRENDVAPETDLSDPAGGVHPRSKSKYEAVDFSELAIFEVNEDVIESSPTSFTFHEFTPSRVQEVKGSVNPSLGSVNPGLECETCRTYVSIDATISDSSSESSLCVKPQSFKNNRLASRPPTRAQDQSSCENPSKQTATDGVKYNNNCSGLRSVTSLDNEHGCADNLERHLVRSCKNGLAPHNKSHALVFTSGSGENCVKYDPTDTVHDSGGHGHQWSRPDEKPNPPTPREKTRRDAEIDPAVTGSRIKHSSTLPSPEDPELSSMINSSAPGTIRSHGVVNQIHIKPPAKRRTKELIRDTTTDGSDSNSCIDTERDAGSLSFSHFGSRRRQYHRCDEERTANRSGDADAFPLSCCCVNDDVKPSSTSGKVVYSSAGEGSRGQGQVESMTAACSHKKLRSGLEFDLGSLDDRGETCIEFCPRLKYSDELPCPSQDLLFLLIGGDNSSSIPPGKENSVCCKHIEGAITYNTSLKLADIRPCDMCFLTYLHTSCDTPWSVMRCARFIGHKRHVAFQSRMSALIGAPPTNVTSSGDPSHSRDHFLIPLGDMFPLGDQMSSELNRVVLSLPEMYFSDLPLHCNVPDAMAFYVFSLLSTVVERLAPVLFNHVTEGRHPIRLAGADDKASGHVKNVFQPNISNSGNNSSFWDHFVLRHSRQQNTSDDLLRATSCYFDHNTSAADSQSIFCPVQYDMKDLSSHVCTSNFNEFSSSTCLAPHSSQNSLTTIEKPDDNQEHPSSCTETSDFLSKTSKTVHLHSNKLTCAPLQWQPGFTSELDNTGNLHSNPRVSSFSDNFLFSAPKCLFGDSKYVTSSRFSEKSSADYSHKNASCSCFLLSTLSKDDSLQRNIEGSLIRSFPDDEPIICANILNYVCLKCFRVSRALTDNTGQRAFTKICNVDPLFNHSHRCTSIEPLLTTMSTARTPPTSLSSAPMNPFTDHLNPHNSLDYQANLQSKPSLARNADCQSTLNIICKKCLTEDTGQTSPEQRRICSQSRGKAKPISSASTPLLDNIPVFVNFSSQQGEGRGCVILENCGAHNMFRNCSGDDELTDAAMNNLAMTGEENQVMLSVGTRLIEPSNSKMTLNGQRGELQDGWPSEPQITNDPTPAADRKQAGDNPVTDVPSIVFSSDCDSPHSRHTREQSIGSLPAHGDRRTLQTDLDVKQVHLDTRVETANMPVKNDEIAAAVFLEDGTKKVSQATRKSSAGALSGSSSWSGRIHPDGYKKAEIFRGNPVHLCSAESENPDCFVTRSLMGGTLSTLIPLATQITRKYAANADEYNGPVTNTLQQYDGANLSLSDSNVTKTSKSPVSPLTLPQSATNAIHSTLLGCLPTYATSKNVVKIEATAGSTNKTYEFFVRSVFDAFFDSTGMCSASEPCLATVSADEEIYEFPLFPLSSGNIHADGSKSGRCFYNLPDRSQNLFRSGSRSPNRSCSRGSGMSHSWYSLNDLDPGSRPNLLRKSRFMYLAALRRQLNNVFSPKTLRQFFGISGDGSSARKAGNSRLAARDRLSTNHINVIITRCESLVLEKHQDEEHLPPMRDRAATLDPAYMDKVGTRGSTELLYNSNARGGGGGAHVEQVVTAKPRASSLDTTHSSVSPDDQSRSPENSIDRSRGCSLDLLSPASASNRTGSMCSGMSSISRLTECSAYTETSRSGD